MLQLLDLLTAALVLSPIPSTCLPDRSPLLLASLQRVNVAWQLAGTHQGYGQYGAEVAYSRQTLADLLDAPGLGDAIMLPPHCDCVQRCLYLDQLARYLDARRTVYLHRDEELTEAATAARRDALLWELAAKVMDTRAAYRERRLALRELRARGYVLP